jgi:hypothetical protein
LHQQQGARRAFGTAPNMLARLFDRAPEFHSRYPDVVWRYLDSVPPLEPGGGTRREQLVRGWVKLGRIDPPGSPKAERRIDLLTSGPSSHAALTIDLLADRAMMLSDVRSRVGLMKRDLAHLVAQATGRRI